MADEFIKYGLQADDIHYLQDALVRCLSSGQDLQDIFYQRLFEVAPHVKAMFGDDIARQKKMFSTLLAAAVSEMLDPSALWPQLKQTGDAHRRIGIDRTAIELGREPFLAAVEASIGSLEYGQNHKRWDHLYSALTDIMMGNGT